LAYLASAIQVIDNASILPIPPLIGYLILSTLIPMATKAITPKIPNQYGETTPYQGEKNKQKVEINTEVSIAEYLFFIILCAKHIQKTNMIPPKMHIPEAGPGILKISVICLMGKVKLIRELKNANNPIVESSLTEK